MNLNKKSLKDEGELFEDPGKYLRPVGKLSYLNITRKERIWQTSIFSKY
jgi:hypothetical protein